MPLQFSQRTIQNPCGDALKHRASIAVSGIYLAKN
jgi:hypothetical protein